MKPMSADEYRSALAKLGFSQVGAARFFMADPRTGRRWAADGPPGGVAVALRIMLRLKLSAAQAVKLLSR
jgi:hypothetical protein